MNRDAVEIIDRELTIPDRYNIPFINYCNIRLHGCIPSFQLWTWLELINQVDIFPDDICKTAIISSFGLYEYVKMPFGLRYAAQSAVFGIVNEIECQAIDKEGANKLPLQCYKNWLTTALRRSQTRSAYH